MRQIIFRLIYNPIINRILRIVNKSFSPILPREFKIPPSGILKIRNEFGKKLKIKTNQTNYLTKIVFWEGYQNFEYTNIFIKLIKKINVFYDIGANIGFYSLLAEMENPEIKVVAFEPATGPLYYLNENVRINNFKQIRIENIALSDRNGMITFYEIRNKKYSYLEYNLAGEGNTGSVTAIRNFIPITVKTKTLNDYVLDADQEDIDLIKIDTEGTEHLILEHAETILKQMKPIVICEILFDVIESDLQTIFKKYGYDFYNYTGIGLEKVETIIRKIDNGVRNCFFVHPSKFYLIEEFVQ